MIWTVGTDRYVTVVSNGRVCGKSTQAGDFKLKQAVSSAIYCAYLDINNNRDQDFPPNSEYYVINVNDTNLAECVAQVCLARKDLAYSQWYLWVEFQIISIAHSIDELQQGVMQLNQQAINGGRRDSGVRL
jgi:hypothetical protein